MSTAVLETPVMQKFDPERLREYREQAGLSQAQAAKAAGLAQGRWSEMERGERLNPTLDVLGRIAQALECEVQDLLTPPKPKRGRA